MRHFMSDNGADPAVVHRVVGIGVEERRLQNARGEHDLVHVWVVVRVHRRRRHPPVRAIHWLADLLQVAIGLEFSGAHRVQHVRAAINLQQ